MRIVLVEDDYLQAEDIELSLSRAYGEVSVERIPTESAFRMRLPSLAANPPDIFIIDIMLRWTDPSPLMSPSPEDARGKNYRAGLRCRSLVESDHTLCKIPVVLYTVLEYSDLARELSNISGIVRHLRKEGDHEPLIERIQELSALRGR